MLDTRKNAKDETRALTDKGRRQAERMGRLLKRLDVRFDCVLASPLTRAVETADVVLDAMGSPVAIQTFDVFRPNGPAEEQRQAIHRADGKSMLVVGHLPSIGELATVFLRGRNEPLILFHKSTLAALKCAAEGDVLYATLEWIVSPAMAKRL